MTSGRAGARPLLLVAAAVEAMTYGTVFALLADLQTEYDLPTWGLGVITAAAFFASFGAQVGLARFADRGHAILLVRTGLLINAAGTFLFVVGSELWHFILARMVLGLGSGMFLPAVRRVLVVGRTHEAGALLGRLAAVEIGGFVLGPPFAAFVADWLGLKAPFVAQLVALAVCAPAVGRLTEPPVADGPIPLRASRELLRRPGVRGALALGAGVFVSIGVFDSIWSKYLTDLGASTKFIGITLTMWAAPMVLLTPAGGRLADRVGPTRIGVTSLALTAPIVAAYGVESLVVVCVVALLHSLFEAVTTPAAQAAVAQSSGSELLAAGQGLYGASGNLVAGASAVAAAPVYDAFGAPVLWTAAAVVIGACVIIARVQFAVAAEADADANGALQRTRTGTR
jgi:MFS family permease